MNEVVLFPDVEALLVRVLPERVGVDVSTKVPNPRPASFVRVKRVGGSRPNRVTDSAIVVVECWAADDVAASDLGRLTEAHVFALAQTSHDGDFVRRVREVGGLQSFPDPVSESPRYQFTVSLDTRGVAL
jgi:hypothetical protein